MSGRRSSRDAAAEPKHDVGRRAQPVPTTTAIRPFTTGVSGIASAGPLELRGGGAIALDRLPTTLPLDWQAEALAHVESVCAQRRAENATWLTLPPTMLAGDKGAGRLHVARQIANHAGLPHYVWDVSCGSDPKASAPREIVLPPAPIMAMLASGCANPVISIVGIEQAAEETIETLGQMLDSKASKRRLEPSLGATVDLSNVSWLVTSRDAGVFPLQIEKLLRPVRLYRVKQQTLRLAALSASDEAIFNLGLRGRQVDIALGEIVKPFSRALPDFSEIYAEAHLAVSIEVED